VRGKVREIASATISAEREVAVASSGQLHTRLVIIASTADPDAMSSAHSLDGVEAVQIRRGERQVERNGATLTLAFPDAWVSNQHARLVRGDQGWMLEDLGSKNGTVVDGAHAVRTLLADGMVIEVGRSVLYFQRWLVPALPAHLTGDVVAAGLPAWPKGMATFSPALADKFGALARLATRPVPLVLTGETGTGKEIIAHAIHELSGRTGELVPVNCGALATSLVEAELFGHRRGAFTGAEQRRGLIRSADRGTLLLDEIAELPLSSQAALLRVLQEREVLAVGDDRPTPVNFRLISATLRDLRAAVRDGSFRADLHARIAAHTTELPPLRARREDLGLLVRDLLARHAPGTAPVLAPSLWRWLLRHDWPYNIRDLEQLLSAALCLSDGDVIRLEHVSESICDGGASRTQLPAVEASIDRQLDEDDAALYAILTEQLEAQDGNVGAVARELGKHRAQIYKWIHRLDIDLGAFRRKR